MSISPFFRALRSAYQSEIDDLTSDSEGRDVLRKRLAEKRKELGFLVQMEPRLLVDAASQCHTPALLGRHCKHATQCSFDEKPHADSTGDGVAGQTEK